MPSGVGGNPLHISWIFAAECYSMLVTGTQVSQLHVQLPKMKWNFHIKINFNILTRVINIAHIGILCYINHSRNVY